MKITICDHPLIQHKLSYLRQPPEIIHFRDYENLIYEIGLLLGYEAASSLELAAIDTSRMHIHTSTDGSQEAVHWRAGQKIKRKPVIVPIVRSGLIMANAVRAVIPTAYMGHIGLFNDEQGTPQEFMVTMPDIISGRHFIIVDLFIDRGLKAEKAINIIREFFHEEDPSATPSISFVSLIISVEGQAYLSGIEAMNDVNFYCAHLDSADDVWLPDFTHTNLRLYRTDTPRKGVA